MHVQQRDVNVQKKNKTSTWMMPLVALSCQQHEEAKWSCKSECRQTDRKLRQPPPNWSRASPAAQHISTHIWGSCFPALFWCHIDIMKRSHQSNQIKPGRSPTHCRCESRLKGVLMVDAPLYLCSRGGSTVKKSSIHLSTHPSVRLMRTMCVLPLDYRTCGCTEAAAPPFRISRQGWTVQ